MMKNVFLYIVFACTIPVWIQSCRNNSSGPGSNHQLHEVYTCPMHPEIVKDAPGSCPLCGMDLVKKENIKGDAGEVELDALLKPSNAFVISTIPVTAMNERKEQPELKVVGTVAYDTRQTNVISSRVTGRIERLYVRYRFQPVQKGQRIMDIYSPELVTAQQNLLFLLKNDPANQSMIRAATERLMLSGLSAAQVEELIRTRVPNYSVPVFSSYSGYVTEANGSNGTGLSAGNMQTAPAASQELMLKEGMYVQAGQTVLSLYNPARAWILLDLFPGQQSFVQVGNSVQVIPETAPHRQFRAAINYIEPIYRQGSRTALARVHFNNASMKLPVGSRVTATIFTRPQSGWWLPREAVLSLGRERIVFLKEKDGFRAHGITTGVELDRFIQVLKGLQQEDSVAANAQFLVDNEAFIKLKQP